MEWFSDIYDQLIKTWAYLTTGRVLAVVLGIVFALIAISLLIASRTKWGQTKPLTKCVVISVLLHVWLLMYALGTPKILPQGSLSGKEQQVSVAFEQESSTPPPPAPSVSANSAEPLEPESETEPSEAEKPWEAFTPNSELPKPPALEALNIAADLAPDLLPPLEPTPPPSLPPTEDLADESAEEASSSESSSHDSSEQIASNLPPVETNEETPPESVPMATPVATPTQQVASDRSASAERPESKIAPNPNLPREYQLRQAPNRLQVAAAFGADADTERAVEAGLNWLVKAQAANGAWIAWDHGAGTDTRALGEYRYGTGDRADTGITGLALLAFLSAGHTHLDGDFRQTVESGLAFLLDAQMPSGDLSGPKQVGNDRAILNARMYCHGIATLALAEAYAMTLDARLRPALLKAAQYTINAQDVRGGGWRYSPGDPGDLSQFGWQAMSLKSVERSGIKIPGEVQHRMRRFLDSCAAGRQGGLATYRPRMGRPSDTMTAESLACRLLLNYPLSRQAQREATDMILASRPGATEDNVYFWYYATLALFQLQDENWRVWNQAMKERLLTSQVPAYGDEPGSWNPDNLWGGYGGRVFSTAMSCLCLEVYYRYLPMYQRSNLARGAGPVPR